MTNNIDGEKKKKVLIEQAEHNKKKRRKSAVLHLQNPLRLSQTAKSAKKAESCSTQKSQTAAA